MPRDDSDIDDMLISTSVHITVGQKKEMNKLFPRSGTSRFIREAITKALQDRRGLAPVIRILERKREFLKQRLAHVESEITRLKKEAKRCAKLTLEERRSEIIHRAIQNVASYANPKAVFDDLHELLEVTTRKEEAQVMRQIERIWSEERES